MMQNAANTISLSRDLWKRFSLKLTFLLILASVPPVFLLISNRTIPALMYLAVPFVVLFLCSPRYSFYLFAALNFIYTPYFMTGFAVHPWDIAAFIFIGAVIISWFFKYSPTIDKTALDYSIIALIMATVLSAVFAYKPSLSVVPTARIILLYFMFRSIYYLAGKMSSFKILGYFIHIFTLFSLYNCIVFFASGGSLRIFRISGIAFETFCLIGVPVSLAFAIWSQKKAGRFFYSIIFLINLAATIATMSRGALLTLFIAVPVLLFVSHRKAKRMGCNYARRYVRGFVMVLIPLLLIAVVASGYFLLLGERLEELGADQPTGTILLRLSLWKAAFNGFLLDPLTGIGIGNFRVIDDLLTNLKFDAVRYYIVGMSFHNVFLQYLSETGLPGALAIFFLGWTAFRLGRRIMHKNDQKSDMPLTAALYISSFVFFITIFYMRAWTWGQEGYVLAIILGLLARACRPHQISTGR